MVSLWSASRREKTKVFDLEEKSSQPSKEIMLDSPLSKEVISPWLKILDTVSYCGKVQDLWLCSWKKMLRKVMKIFLSLKTPPKL